MFNKVTGKLTIVFKEEVEGKKIYVKEDDINVLMKFEDEIADKKFFKLTPSTYVAVDNIAYFTIGL